MVFALSMGKLNEETSTITDSFDPFDFCPFFHIRKIVAIKELREGERNGDH